MICGRWVAAHKSGCPIHDSFIVMGGVRPHPHPRGRHSARRAESPSLPFCCPPLSRTALFAVRLLDRHDIMVKEAKQKRDLRVWLCLRWKYLENFNPASQPFPAQATANPKAVSSTHPHKLYFHAKRGKRHEVPKRRERHAPSPHFPDQSGPFFVPSPHPTSFLPAP
jgi:hypothetical protein